MLLTKHQLEFLSLKGGCTGSSESTLFKMPHCWKSHVAATYDLLYHLLVHLQRLRRRSSLIWVHTVCLYVEISPGCKHLHVHVVDNFSRRHDFQMHFFVAGKWLKKRSTSFCRRLKSWRGIGRSAQSSDQSFL